MIKKLLVVIIIFISIIFMNNMQTYAVLQADGTEGSQYNLNYWMINTRKMESSQGSMGLTEDSIGSNLLSAESNGIDIHMQKNSEYAAVAILSTSNYGKYNKVENEQTTTGNSSGVKIILNQEWVAAGGASSCANFNNSAARYKNKYYYSYEAKKSDAISETYGWYGGTGSWGASRSGDGFNACAAVVRALSSSIFSYEAYVYDYRENYAYHWDRSNASYTANHHSRAVVVQSENI